MHQYEMALVVNARIEDEERASVVDRVKEYISRFGGTNLEVDEWGKRQLSFISIILSILTQSRRLLLK